MRSTIVFGLVASLAWALPSVCHASAHRSKSHRQAHAAGGRSVRHAKKRAERYPPMTLVNVNSRDKRPLIVRIYDREGRSSREAARRLTSFLRCHRTGRKHTIHWRLMRNLYTIARHFDFRTIYVYSGYRHRSVALLKESFHTKGQALDFRVAGISNRRLRDYLMKRFTVSGVGYYTRSPFVHFDVRRRRAFWIDFSGPGETPRYATNPYQLLAADRRGIRITEPAHQPEEVALAAAKQGADAASQPGVPSRTSAAETPIAASTTAPNVAAATVLPLGIVPDIVARVVSWPSSGVIVSSRLMPSDDKPEASPPTSSASTQN